MLDALLPRAVAVVETTERLTAGALLPEEAGSLGRAAPRRAAEFAAGRTCARRALARLGAGEPPILRGADREPLWPAGVAGSITHCAGYCAAAVARAASVRSLGIDAEPHAELPPGILERIALPEEARWVRARAGDGIHWDRLLFSAKEAVFKTWFPLTRRWLEFDGARIVFSPRAGTFAATLRVAAPDAEIGTLRGRFLVADGLVVTAIAVPALRVVRPTAPIWTSAGQRQR
jgi:4'-phosphopantetheinyl transferase EntD